MMHFPCTYGVPSPAQTRHLIDPISLSSPRNAAMPRRPGCALQPRPMVAHGRRSNEHSRPCRTCGQSIHAAWGLHMQPLQVVQARLQCCTSQLGAAASPVIIIAFALAPVSDRPTDRPTDYPQPRPNIIAFPFHPTVCPDPLLLFDLSTYIGNF